MSNNEKPYSLPEFQEIEDKIKALKRSEDIFLSLPRKDRKMVDYKKIRSEIEDAKLGLKRLLAKAQTEAIDEDKTRNEIKQYQNLQDEIEGILGDISKVELAEN